MNIFIAKLSPKTTDESLHTLFQEYGEVETAKVIIDRETGRSKCYGFVEMRDDHEANEAIQDLDGVEFEGSNIVVKQARPKANRSNQNDGRRSIYKRY
jgi:RNA recognition motif-containing protein